MGQSSFRGKYTPSLENRRTTSCFNLDRMCKRSENGGRILNSLSRIMARKLEVARKQPVSACKTRALAYDMQASTRGGSSRRDETYESLASIQTIPMVRLGVLRLHLRAHGPAGFLLDEKRRLHARSHEGHRHPRPGCHLVERRHDGRRRGRPVRLPGRHRDSRLLDDRIPCDQAPRRGL